MNEKIKNIIFDFGDIFINLDKEAPLKGIFELDPHFSLDPETDKANKNYETGQIDTDAFVAHYLDKIPGAHEKDLIRVWNSIILDLPDFRVDFLESLSASGKYRLFLLSNTNALHMEQVLINTGMPLFERFKGQFEQFYLSHEIGMRKPDAEIYNFVIEENKLEVSETLFVDDLPENTDSAASIGLHTWNLQPGKEDVTQLFSKDLPL
ncbi:HAD family hydrolase [Robertkochia sediminum]|uniref:HAD family hydrolase n=1 Tax=Robertkochia sediminum TaxID=2785326 RepID=UPI00193305E3|nr:HAD family phosphatase [Robertkochia sediminum]MBL7473687.1 HAD family phosphatase [Robertkochia sediminum]